jgi:hypothetical protein
MPNKRSPARKRAACNVLIFQTREVSECRSMATDAPDENRRRLELIGATTMYDVFMLDEEAVEGARIHFATDNEHRRFTRWWQRQWRDYEVVDVFGASDSTAVVSVSSLPLIGR